MRKNEKEVKVCLSPSLFERMRLRNNAFTVLIISALVMVFSVFSLAVFFIGHDLGKAIAGFSYQVSVCIYIASSLLFVLSLFSMGVSVISIYKSAKNDYVPPIESKSKKTRQEHNHKPFYCFFKDAFKGM